MATCSSLRCRLLVLLPGGRTIMRPILLLAGLLQRMPWLLLLLLLLCAAFCGEGEAAAQLPGEAHHAFRLLRQPRPGLPRPVALGAGLQQAGIREGQVGCSPAGAT